MKKPTRLKRTLGVLLFATIGLKIVLQGNTASPDKNTQLSHLQSALEPLSYQTVLLDGEDKNPIVLAGKGDCIFKISVVQPDGLNNSAFDSSGLQMEKSGYAFKGVYFEPNAPRYWPILSQSIYKLLHSMKIKAVYYPLFKVASKNGCYPAQDLIAATG